VTEIKKFSLALAYLVEFYQVNQKLDLECIYRLTGFTFPGLFKLYACHTIHTNKNKESFSNIQFV